MCSAALPTSEGTIFKIQASLQLSAGYHKNFLAGTFKQVEKFYKIKIFFSVDLTTMYNVSGEFICPRLFVKMNLKWDY